MSRRDGLEDSLRRLELALDEAEPGAVAALVRERRLTLAEIEGLPSEIVGEVTALERIRAKRARSVGLSDSAGVESAGRRSQPRRSGRSDRAG